jgi:hypothetical protein
VCVRVRNHKCLISWGLVRHIAHPPFLTKINKMIITGGPVVAALVCALLAIAGGGTCVGRRATRVHYYDGNRHGGGR